VNGAGAQKTNPIGFLGPDPSTVIDGPARPSRHGASSAPSRRADCRKRVLPGRFRPARPGPSQWFTVECQSRPRPSHPASCDRPTWGPPGSYFGKRGAGVALPAGSNGPGRPARALPAIARFEQLARRAADPQMLEHSNLRLTRATCVGCHRPPLGAGTPRRVSSSAAARTDSADTVSNALRSSLARSFAAWAFRSLCSRRPPNDTPRALAACSA
jgi:hypothetical protein